MNTPNGHRRDYPSQSSEPSSRVADPSFSDDGVDLTLIRWMLSLTPTERLRVLESTVASIVSLRNARAGI